MLIILSVIFAVLFVISVIRDPRRFRCALFFFGTVAYLPLIALAYWLSSRKTVNEAAYGWLALTLLTMLIVVILGAVLIFNGFTMIRKEGRRLSNLVGLLLGLMMVGYVVMGVYSITKESAILLVFLLAAGFPLSLLGFSFVSFLLYSWVYLAVARRWSKPADAVIVLGSGLVNNKVTPLLASRLEAGISLLKQAPDNDKPLFVVSGGMGSDEARSEASAMAEYLVGKGIPEDKIIQEDQSRTTKENISNTKDLLTQAGFTGRVVTVTNSFHAFRSALLLQRANLPGYAVGSPTARYYWPAAVIREYVAILVDSLPFTIACLVLSSLPLIIMTVGVIINS
ncbi:MAG: YdcF family protein [Propionibacteriaceae bacterium]|nr:YdcF family protein [Propionibacteriaceae bacterium]